LIDPHRDGIALLGSAFTDEVAATTDRKDGSPSPTTYLTVFSKQGQVTNVAPPGEVLVAESARAAIGDVPGIAWSFAESRHLRGIRDEVRLFRASRRAMA
jgi:hypothetical protein